MTFFSRSLNFIVFLYYTYIHGVSGDQSISHIQNAEQSENQGRRPTINSSVPIACRVCDKIFFDNISLVLHFECHLNDEILFPGEHIRSPTALPGNRNLSSSPSSFSSPFVERMSEIHHAAVPVMGEDSRAHRLPGGSTNTTNGLPTDVGSVQIPVVNPIPPLSLSLDARLGLLQSGVRSTMSRRTSSSSLSYPPFYTKLGRSSMFPRGLAALPLHLNEQNNIGNFSISRNQEINQNQIAEPYKEIVVISDDEEDNSSSPVEMLDLTLKL